MSDRSTQLNLTLSAKVDPSRPAPLDWEQIGALVRQAACVAVAEHMVHSATVCGTDPFDATMGFRRSNR